MSEPTPPTPRTDAFIMAHLGWCPTDWNWRLFARQLERENADLRKMLEAALSDNVLKDHGAQIAQEKIAAMRDAIRFVLANHNTDPEACIDKLQPFTTP
jgi:hypothetical protein